MSEVNRLFCFGYGYVAQHVAPKLQAKGWQVAGTTTREDKASQMQNAGIEAHILNDDVPFEAAQALDGATHMLVSIPPKEQGDIALHACKPVLGGLDRLQWVGYLSTTGVYGDHDGDWVDETTPAAPLDERSKRRVLAEQAWQDAMRTHAGSMQIFRLAGIYGSGRNALEQLQAGTARRIYKEGQYFSRTHVEDIATLLVAAMLQGHASDVFNVADEAPAPSHEVTEYAAQLMEMQPPPLIPIEQADLSPMAQSFYASNKRVNAEKIRLKHGVSLAFPTYREGLDAIWQAICK